MSETEETRELVDVLAENIHALWVQERTDKGATDISKPNASDKGDRRSQDVAVRHLAEELTATETEFPGTDWRLISTLPGPS